MTFRKYSLLEMTAISLASCALAAAALTLALKLTLAPTYNDFIVGDITWQAQTKIQDLVAAPVFILILFSGFIFLSQLILRLEKHFNTARSEELISQLFYWSIPFVVAVGGMILGSSIDKPLFFLSAAGLIAIGTTAGYSTSRRIESSPFTVGMALFGMLLVALIPMEIALLLARLPVRFTYIINSADALKITYLFSLIGFFVVSVMAIRAPKRLSLWLPKLMLMGQITLPLFALTLYPARLVTPDGAISKYSTTWGLKALLLSFMLWGAYDVIRRYRKSCSAAVYNWTSLLSPVAIFALLVAIKIGITIAPNIPSDDYHYGESLIGWWSYLHGTIPYVGYLPPHGLVPDDLAGFISSVFYDGTGGTLTEVARLSCSILALIAFMSLYLFSGSIGLAMVAIIPLLFTGWGGASYSALFLTPFLCLWFSKSLREDPSRWLSIWLLTVPIILLGIPAQGLLFVATSGAIALYCVWDLSKHSDKRKWGEIAGSLLILSITALATPLVPMLYGAVRYVLENSGVNQLVWGLPWELAWNANSTKSPSLIFEIVRMSWIAIPLTSLAIMHASFKNRATWLFTSLPAIVVMLFSLLLIPYSMGRIDPNSVSRMGLAALFGWTVLIPIVVWTLAKPGHRPALLLLVAGISASLNLSSFSLRSLIPATSAQVASGPLRDGPSAGLNNLGITTIQDDHWDRLLKLNALLSKELLPGEMFLDLSSRQAQYFYLNQLPPVAVTAPYNMVPLPQQQRAVLDMSKHLPQLALLEGGGLSLRNPVLYRFVLDNYLPTIQDGFTVGHTIQSSERNSFRLITFPVKDITDQNWVNGIARNEAALIVGEPSLLSTLTVGTQVILGNGEQRNVTKVLPEDSIIYLDGARLDQSQIGNIKYKGKEPELSMSLFEKAFGIPALLKTPVAWGKSEATLLKKMSLVEKLESYEANSDLVLAENGAYTITGGNPQFIFDLSHIPATGRDAGLLRFVFSCTPKALDPVIRVSWWHNKLEDANKAASLTFVAENGTMIVPLDAYARWLLADSIQGVAIGLDNAAACGSISVKDVSLYQRNEL